MGRPLYIEFTRAALPVYTARFPRASRVRHAQGRPGSTLGGQDEHGRFAFFRGRAERVERTITENVQNLILEGLRRMDELSHVASLLPKDHEPLFLAPEPPHDDIRLTAKEWRVLSLVNGKRSVRQIRRAKPNSG